MTPRRDSADARSVEHHLATPSGRQASILDDDHRHGLGVAHRPPPDPDELRVNLRQADPGVLVAVLAQLTGDPSVIDSFAPKISHVPDPPERAGVTDPETAEALVDRHHRRARSGPRARDAVPADDPELFARLLPMALGSDVDDEYVTLLLEQGGFQPLAAGTAAHRADPRRP